MHAPHPLRRVLRIRIGHIMQVRSIMVNERPLDHVAIPQLVCFKQGSNRTFMSIEETEIGLVEGVDSPVEVHIEDIVGLEFHILPHILKVGRDIVPILGKERAGQGVLGTIVNLVVEIELMLAKINKVPEPLL